MVERREIIPADPELRCAAHRRAAKFRVKFRAEANCYTARMFTGIVQAKVLVQAIDRHAAGARLTIDRSSWTPAHGYTPAPGDSICVAGVCLTITEATADALSFDVVAETLRCTTLGDLKPNAIVNLEPALLASQPLGGHVLQGHVDALGTVADVQRDEAECRIAIELPAPSSDLADLVVPKGSIAVDGVSLTVASAAADRFEVALIPTTLSLTTLGTAEVGDHVNLETDILTRTVVHALKRWQGGGDAKPGRASEPVTWRLLREAGFVRQ